MQIELEQLEKSEKRYEMSQDQSRSKFDPSLLSSLVDETISTNILKGNIIDTKSNLNNRKQLIREAGFEPAEFAYERAIGENDSVYTNFVDLLIDAKRKVGRIVVLDGNERLGYATGFMISDNLLLTNWHVFNTISDVKNSLIQFNHELDKYGRGITSTSFKLSPDTFFYSFKDLDYCLVAVGPKDITNNYDLADIGFIHLDPTLGKLGDEDVELLNIIHHPEGDYKQLSIRENRFTKILPTSIWYESDTAPGSSGSPVFNDQWQLVALHHMGVAEKNKNGDYVDRKGDTIPIVNGRIDISRIHWIANEGIRISVIRNHIQSNFPNSSIISKLINPSGNGLLPSISENKEARDQTIQPSIPFKNCVRISIPSDLVESQKTVNVNITTNDVFSSKRTDTSAQQFSSLPTADLEDESLKLERSMDYTRCEGYVSDFLGEEPTIPIPKAQSSIRNHIARINNSRAYILKYYKFSVIFNAFKKMPLISAINVDGDPDKRKDFSERDDKWIRDTRIDLDSQLNNDFYSKSGFDRGHMSRREDANWGEDAVEAKRNADLTCVHTNACPQVPELNRSNRSGLWGKLEKVVLENGAKKEDGKTGKISVFSGPIFKGSDPIYKGVKIPMEFYKVIIWLNDNDQLRATAFTLSQTDLVEEINFEDIDIDQNITFKEYQCSINKLQNLTKIDFSKITPFDTFQGDGNDVEIRNESQLLEVLRK